MNVAHHRAYVLLSVDDDRLRPGSKIRILDPEFGDCPRSGFPLASKLRRSALFIPHHVEECYADNHIRSPR
jgi:hypothetical protein